MIPSAARISLSSNASRPSTLRCEGKEVRMNRIRVNTWTDRQSIKFAAEGYGVRKEHSSRTPNSRSRSFMSKSLTVWWEKRGWPSKIPKHHRKRTAKLLSYLQISWVAQSCTGSQLSGNRHIVRLLSTPEVLYDSFWKCTITDSQAYIMKQ